MEMKISADYVVVGAGAMGMAFTDEILSRTDSTVALIDELGKPGGHWNHAYPFVRLHQPSFFYGVNSEPLGSGQIDRTGWNEGLSELASGAEVCAYFDQVMQRRFLPSARVQYFPCTRYGDGLARSRPSGETFEVHAEKALVDATFMKVSVPAIRPPKYTVDEGVRLVPPNDLPSIDSSDGYCIVGAGKTAMDAVLWLLSNRVPPSAITWITPRDSWLLNRAMIQPGDGFRLGDQTQHLAGASSAKEAWQALERAEHMLRIDPSVEPTMYRCATVTVQELEQLRRVDNIVRLGRVQRISKAEVVLDRGVLPMTPETTYVDCTADGLERRPVTPVFSDAKITLQTVRGCQQVFSAALIGMVESLDLAPEAKNELATVIPHPDTPADFFSNTAEHIQNVGRWGSHPEVQSWLDESRLSPTVRGPVAVDPAEMAALVTKLVRFQQEAEGPT